MSNLQIQPKDLTFCYQGEIHPYTGHCILQTMQSFPESRFVIASNNEIPDDIRRIVAGHCWSEPIPWNKDNLLRHMKTTHHALEMAATPYSCKIRTDCFLRSSRILNIFDASEDKIAVGNWHSYYLTLPFFFCDFLFLGRTDTIKQIFQPNNWPNLERFHPKPKWLSNASKSDSAQVGDGCRPEQFIAGNWCEFNQQLNSAEDMDLPTLEWCRTTKPYQTFKPFSCHTDWELSCVKYPDLCVYERSFHV